MNEEHKQIECISKMKKEYFDKFCTIVEGYREKISDNLVIGDSAFTLHDFDHHCFDIYKIISEVLFDEELVYSEKYGLSERELYIMNLAVLFHDIGMSNGLDRARDNHSLNSADYIDRQFKDSRSVLSQNSDLSANEIKALKAIIIAHSNLKDRSVQESDNGLKSHKLQDYKARLGIIRTRFLAGVLRLADELDVSVERLGTGELQQELEEQEQKYNIIKNKQNCSEIEEKQMEEWKGFEKSLEFWHKLHLISSVERKEDDDKQIVLVVDDDYVQQKLDESQTETSIARQLVEIYSKINKELKEAVEISFTGKKLVNYVPIREIVITTEIESLNKEIDKSLNVRSLEPVSLEDKEDKKKTNFVEKNNDPIIIDTNLENEISMEVNNRSLIKIGHFLLTKEYCARDWIDTLEVVETKVILNKIVNAIVKHINNSGYDDYIIAGVDLVGTLLASRIAFTLQAPLTYIVPEKEKNVNAHQEIDLEIEKDKKVHMNYRCNCNIQYCKISNREKQVGKFGYMYLYDVL